MVEPKVTIIMISYRQRKDWFMTAMRSIHAQSYKNKEIVLSCVVSAPEIEWAKAFDGVQVVENRYPDPKEQINSGIKFASGDYVIHVASDDFFYRNAIADMVFTATEKDSVLVYSSHQHCDENLDIVFYQEAPEFTLDKLHKLQIMGDCSLVKKSVLWEFGLFNVEWKKFSIWDMWLKIADKYPDRIHRTGKVMCKYRRHDGALSLRAFRGEVVETGENLRKKFYKTHGIKPGAKSEYIGHNIVTNFNLADKKIILDNNLVKA